MVRRASRRAGFFVGCIGGPHRALWPTATALLVVAIEAWKGHLAAILKAAISLRGGAAI